MWNALVKIVAIVTVGLVVDDLGSKAIDKFNNVEGSYNPNTGEAKLCLQNQADDRKKRKRLPRS